MPTSMMRSALAVVPVVSRSTKASGRGTNMASGLTEQALQEPAAPAIAGLALAVDPEQLAQRIFGDVIVSRHQRIVPPSGLDPFGAGQELQRRPIDRAWS